MAANEKTKKDAKKEAEKLKCGLVMPISAFGDYTEHHWQDVKTILTNAVESAGFDATLVSDANEAGIIQDRIIQNLYDNPIVVCDVSGKNPNAMFELGLRLAFDKPTIIVKDDETDYSFDTSIIEHLEYPRGLRHNKIEAFKDDLRGKVDATYKKATSDPSYTTFLKHFGKFRVAQIETTEVSKEDYIMEKLQDIERSISRISRTDSDLSKHEYQGFRKIGFDEFNLMRREIELKIDSLGKKFVPKEMENDLLSYIETSTKVPAFFKSRSQFRNCFRQVISEFY